MEVPIIDLAEFSDRQEEIKQELLDAALNTGFFYLKNHSICLADINKMFSAAHKFFNLPDDAKGSYAFEKERNAGWEKLAQACELSSEASFIPSAIGSGQL